jgi:4,5-DOPA dioxygenase extradiol
MPVFFVGHSSPMNAIESNAFTRVLEKLGQDLPRPKAIYVVSAHWVTRGSQVLAAGWPRTKASNSAASPCAPFCFNQPLPLIPRIPGMVYAAVCAISARKERISQPHPVR